MTQKLLTVSVVIPTRSRSQLLQKCLQSLCEQTVLPFEIIVVASGNEPYAARVCKMFPTLRIRVAYELIPSYAQTRNRGVRLAKGAIIALLDDDCVAHPGWIQAIQLSHSTSSLAVIQGVGYYNIDGKNIYSTLHNLRNKEGMENQLSLSDQTHEINGKQLPVIHMVDNKNVSFPKKLVGKFPEFYASWLPAYVCADDCELANRLILNHIPILYNTSIIVLHQGRTSLLSTLRRSVEYGRSDWWTKQVGEASLKNIPLTIREKIYVSIVFSSHSRMRRYSIALGILNEILTQRSFSIPIRLYGIVVYLGMYVLRSMGFIYEHFHNTCNSAGGKHGAIYAPWRYSFGRSKSQGDSSR